MQRGFTLIELVIVIAIIGIVVSIAYEGYRNYTNGGVKVNQSPEPQGAKIVPDKPTQ